MVTALAAATALGACGRDGSRQSVTDKSAEAPSKVNEVALQNQQSASATAPGATSARRDGVITTQIESRLSQDLQLRALAIQVRTRDGQVVLSGIAPDTAVRVHATQVARLVQGVVNVENNMTVQMRGG